MLAEWINVPQLTLQMHPVFGSATRESDVKQAKSNEKLVTVGSQSCRN